VVKWKQVWTLPHRLLQKRLLLSPRECDKYHKGPAGDNLGCHYEWLVKWRSLDYEHATWELENASFLCSPEGLGLIRDYENRRRTARSTSRVDKMAQRERSSSDKLSQMTAGGSPGFDNNYLDYVNKLREFWNKCQNAVVIDDQERIVKVIAFMLSLQPDAHQPFLIISTSTALYSWDHEFLRLAPSLYVVVYNGNKDMRKFIRTLEFYEDSGCLLFQVLITSPDVIMTDRDMLECIRWEAIVVDECQRSVISSHFEHIKMLHTDRRLLLVNGQLKDSKDEYLKLLSVLDSSGDLNTDDVSIASSNENCSDHPYVADPSLQELLTTGLQPVEYLDVGINASGKLQLLDLMLMEIKKRGLRALILFQAIGGSGRDTIGDILDDFLRQRFGAESYERVEMGVIRSKKEAAMNMFNNKECGRFVFLLEYRACLPSVKLSSVDTVLIFDSDWTPMNNLRALQRITLDSQPEQIKIFRLYSSFTVEENVLILAKQKKIFESLQNITRSTSHMLLMLGVTHLFDNLDKFHCGNTPASSAGTVSEQSRMKDIVREFLSILLQNGEATDTSNLSIILKVQQVGGFYSMSSPLPGELIVPPSDESQPHIFWAKLLEGKNPPWKYRVGSSQRNRKRVQHIDELPRRSEVDSEEVVKKRKKVVNSNVDPPFLKCRPEERTNAGDKEGEHILSQSARGSTALVNDNLHANHAPTSSWLANSISELPEGNMSESEERRKLHDAQKILHLLLKPQIKQLCQILQLTEDVKDMVEKFLEYVMTNHHVNGEPETILQAFQISLCWTAASLLKHKIDHKESLALAKQHLNFDCKKEEVDYVYSLLRCLKKMFLCRTGIFKVSDYPNVCELSSKGVTDDHSHARLSRSMTSSPQKVNGEVEALSLHQEFSDKQVLSQLGSVPEFRFALKDITKSIKEIQKKCNKQLMKVSQKQEEEKNEIKRTYEEEKSLLEKKHRMESTIFRTCLQSNISLRADKLKILDNEHVNKLEVLAQQLEIRLKTLEDMHQAARNKLAEREARWVEDVKSWAQVELMGKTCSNGPECGVKCLQTTEQVTVHAGPKNVAPVSGNLSEECIPRETAPSLPGHGLGFIELPENVPDKAVACSSAVETLAPLHRPGTANDESNTISSESVSVMGFVNCNGTGTSGDVQAKVGSINPCTKECNRDGATSSMPDDEVLLEVPETVSSSDGTKKVVPSSSEEGRDTLSVPHGEVLMGIRDNSTEFPEKVLSLNLSSTEQIPDEATLSVPGTEVLLKVPETHNSNDGLQNVVSVDGSSLPTEGVPFGVPETVSSNDGLENFLSVTPLSSDEQILDRASLSMPNGEVQLESAASKALEFDNTNNHNDGAYAVASDNFIRVDQQDGVDNTISQNSHSQMLSLVNSPSVQPMTTLDQGSPVPFEQALQDECTPISTSAQFPVRDAPANEMQNTSQQVESSVSNRDEAVPSNRLNHEAATTEPLTQIQLLSPADSHTGNNVDLPSTGGIEPRLSSGAPTSNQLAQTPTQAVENPVELSSQAVSQPSTSYASHLPIDAPMVGLGTHLSDTRMMPTTEISNPPIPNAAPVASSMSLLLYPDPLQYEFERIRKETDQAENSHKDALSLHFLLSNCLCFSLEQKLQLKSDCEKEIEELSAQIRLKYDMKIQEVESEFLLKKKELDANRNKVLMNKILAEAFRSKCMDLRLFQLSMQQNAQRPLTASPSSASPSGASLQNTSLPAASLQTIPPAASPHITNPTVQTFNHSSSVFPSIPTRPPNISPISPPTGNLQVGSEIRAPAPHLQPFRPTSVSPISLPSLQRGLPSQQAPCNSTATSTSLSHQQPRAAAPTYQSGPYSRGQRLETSGGLPSALELLMDVDSQSGAKLRRQPELCSNFDSLNVSEFGTSSTRVNAVRTGGSPDIVCLSDDD
ncbi:helicase protein mom1, partial [Quercus suber]